MFMAMARAAATRATCYRLNVGAVLTQDRNVVAVGYNGAPSGRAHCTGDGCAYYSPTGCTVVHAEANVILRVGAASARSHELYVTHSPCAACSVLLAGRGVLVTDVFYETAYRDASPVQYLIEHGLRVYQLLPSGLVVDQRTLSLVELA